MGILAQALLDEGKIDDLFEHLPFGQRLAALHANFELRLRQWNKPFFGPEFHALINHPGIADALEPHLGPNISFNGDYNLRPKMPDSRTLRVPVASGQHPSERRDDHLVVIRIEARRHHRGDTAIELRLAERDGWVARGQPAD